MPYSGKPHVAGLRTSYICSLNQAQLGDTMQSVSRLGSPQLAFTLFFPLLYALHWGVGVKFLGAAIVSEWLNMVLKWYVL